MARESDQWHIKKCRTGFLDLENALTKGNSVYLICYVSALHSHQSGNPS